MNLFHDDETDNFNKILDKSIMDEEDRVWIVERVNFWRFRAYRNPDKKCTYPFEPCSLGYCWGWAHYIDGTGEHPYCEDCECWSKKE